MSKLKIVNDVLEAPQKFVKKHSSAITAVAAVVTALTTVRIQRDLQSAGRQINDGLKGDARIVEQCINEERDFTYLPGLGVHVHAKTPTPPVEIN